MFIPGVLLALLALDGAASAERPSIRVALAVDSRLPAAVGKAAVEEADAIWRPYGVMVTGADGVAPTLTVALAGSPALPAASSSPFASIRFDEGGPQPIVCLYFERLVRDLAVVRVGGLGPAGWPPALRDRLLGRMAGRAIAHEIGHWLLRTRVHSASGLMRAVQPATQLADAAARIHFRLTAGDLERLGDVRRRLALVDAGSIGGGGVGGAR